MAVKYKRLEVTIDQSSNQITSEIDLGKGGKLQGIYMPAAWTTAAITLQASDASGGTFRDVYDNAGTEESITAAASQYISLYPDTFAGVRFIKIRSGTSATPVTQAAARTLILDIEVNDGRL
jgi:hypothetical protein